MAGCYPDTKLVNGMVLDFEAVTVLYLCRNLMAVLSDGNNTYTAVCTVFHVAYLCGLMRGRHGFLSVTQIG